MNKSDSTSDLNKAKIEAMLRDRGIYPTGQRVAIATVLFAKNQHVTADRVHAMLSEVGFLVSKATVYNTLSTFVKVGLLNEIFIDGGCAYYDSNTSNHHHVYNIDTRELIDIPDNLKLTFDQALLPKGTSLDSVSIVIQVRNSPPHP